MTSVPGQGSTFRVQIPRGFAHLPAECVSHQPIGPGAGREATAHAGEVARWVRDADGVAAPATVPEGLPAGSRPLVLVVDDNPDLRQYIGGMLAPLYDIATAADGEEALESIRTRRPDLVVSDVMMPRLDGLGLVRELRKDLATTTLPVILLSARAGEESAVEGLDAGCDDYLVKPFSARELVARVRTHLDLARARRAWTLQLERANRELDAFSYSVSHDLRAPLRAIDGYSRALAEGELAARERGLVERIRGSVQRMGALIDGLLDLSRVARSGLHRQAVDLSALAERTAEDLRRAHPERTVSVEVEDGLVVQGDRRMLDVLLTNLLGNAWKFTAGRDDARIVCGRHAGPRCAPAFFVRDNGAGFDMAYADRLFAPFQRLHSQREFEGTGIGLAIVSRVVERHGGRVWAEAAHGEGAAFYFTLGPGDEDAS